MEVSALFEFWKSTQRCSDLKQGDKTLITKRWLNSTHSLRRQIVRWLWHARAMRVLRRCRYLRWVHQRRFRVDAAREDIGNANVWLTVADAYRPYSFGHHLSSVISLQVTREEGSVSKVQKNLQSKREMRKLHNWIFRRRQNLSSLDWTMIAFPKSSTADRLYNRIFKLSLLFCVLEARRVHFHSDDDSTRCEVALHENP